MHIYGPYNPMYRRPKVYPGANSSLRLEQEVSRLRAYDERIVMANISKVQRLTGWVPKPNIRLLLRLLLDYWRHEMAFRFPAGQAVRRFLFLGVVKGHVKSDLNQILRVAGGEEACGACGGGLRGALSAGEKRRAG